MSDLQNARIHITGIVQGVGFRPFVYSLAQRLQLAGWVRNTSAGVDIEVDGAPEVLARFIAAPDQVIASGDPTARQLVQQYGSQMPNLNLSQQDVNDLVTYLDTQK